MPVLDNGRVEGEHAPSRSGRLFVFALLFGAIATLVLSVLPGCSVFSRSRGLEPDVARYVVADYARGISAQLLPNNKAKRFVGNLRWPVKDGEVISRFGPRRGRFHAGIDLPAETGTPILAACTGTVEYAGDGGAEFGYVVVLRCGELVTLYAHADELLVETEDKVRQGEEIATVGETGNATGPHLHFETRIEIGQRMLSIDPLLFFPRPRG
jgi:murein DD-endopeptidase MepM/ murein hydrolase activator NlpD